MNTLIQTLVPNSLADFGYRFETNYFIDAAEFRLDVSLISIKKDVTSFARMITKKRELDQELTELIKAEMLNNVMLKLLKDIAVVCCMYPHQFPNNSWYNKLKENE